MKSMHCNLLMSFVYKQHYPSQFPYIPFSLILTKYWCLNNLVHFHLPFDILMCEILHNDQIYRCRLHFAYDLWVRQNYFWGYDRFSITRLFWIQLGKIISIEYIQICWPVVIILKNTSVQITMTIKKFEFILYDVEHTIHSVTTYSVVWHSIYNTRDNVNWNAEHILVNLSKCNDPVSLSKYSK